MRPWVAILLLTVTVVQSGTIAHAIEHDYTFDRTISRPVLENYLDRAITEELFVGGMGNFDDNLRMLKHTGAKYIGRSLHFWGNEKGMLDGITTASKLIPKVHAVDPDMILEACIFEIVTPDVELIPVPDWAFAAFGLAPEHRNFRYKDIVATDNRAHQWGSSGVPDVTRQETKLWFYFQARMLIDAGFEAIHFGQVELIERGDPTHFSWYQVFTQVRAYAREHARRHMVLINGHVPGGGLVRNGKLLLDFHAFPLRIKEIGAQPQEAKLEIGYWDSYFGRSAGGQTYSGWSCEHLPYLVEYDNYGHSDKPGTAVGIPWVWGYDEICWFAHQSAAKRSAFLKYARNWVRSNDPNGHVQMPGSRTLASPVEGNGWYFCNSASSATPQGFGDEDVIAKLWGSRN